MLFFCLSKNQIKDQGKKLFDLHFTFLGEFVSFSKLDILMFLTWFCLKYTKYSKNTVVWC